MIQQEYKNNVEDVSGQVQTTGFNIEVNESMFQMLTSNVYNDPTLAVIREWSTNACDACIAADKEVKFDSHLPTIEEPYFSVRDYGTGLAPEDIVGLFSNLGASTKRGSNAYNGTFGIGRMAGLAVSNAFTVESYFDGTLHSYAISMQEGVPVTLHLGNMPTDEPNGLKLTVQVDYDDINTYVEKAQYLYRYFDHKPALNRDDINIELTVAESLSDDWFVQQAEGHYDYTNYVVMSQVPYAIPQNSNVKNFGFRNLVIKAPPGAVSFNPGRESLSLNKATIDYLNKAFKRIAEEYVASANASLATTTNDFELMKTYEALTKGAPNGVADKINPCTFASDSFKNLFYNPYYHASNNPANACNYVAETSAFDTDTMGTVNLSHKHKYYKNAKRLINSNYMNWHDFFYSNHVVVDLKTKFKAALNELYDNKPLVIWQRHGKEDVDDAVEHSTRYLDELGIPYKLASDLVEEAGLDKLIEKINTPREGLYVSEVYNGNVSKATQMADANITSQDYLYLKLKNTTPDIEDNGYSYDDYISAYHMLSNNGVKVPEIKGVAKKYQSYVDELDNWKDFSTYIEEKMGEANFRIPMGTAVPSLSTRLISTENINNYPQDIQDFYNEVKAYRDYNSTQGFLYSTNSKELAERFGATFDTYEWDDAVDINALTNKYTYAMPLLTGQQWHSHLEPDHVVHLANLEEFHAIHSSK